jgi:phosphodiesterase/alkaline phosphatase D-like protein
MSNNNQKISRRTFVRNTALLSGGVALLPGFLTSCKDDEDEPAINYTGDFGFREDVARFGPSATGVIPWTRYPPPPTSPATRIYAGKWLPPAASQWQVLGSQVLMGKMNIPAELLPLVAQLAAGPTPALLAQYNTQVTQLSIIKTRVLGRRYAGGILRATDHPFRR